MVIPNYFNVQITPDSRKAVEGTAHVRSDVRVLRHESQSIKKYTPLKLNLITNDWGYVAEGYTIQTMVE